MAIGTFSQLKTAVESYLDNTDAVLTALVPDFVTLAESRINADFGTIRSAWTTGSLTGTDGLRTIALPAGFVEPQALYLTTDGSQTELTPFIAGTMPMLTSEGTPEAWSIIGANINLDRLCDQAHTFLLHYRAKWDIATDLTNWLLTNHPDVYLAATLIEAYDFRDNYEAVARQEMKYAAAKERVEQKEARSLAIAPLQVDPGLLGNGGYVFNFTTGQ